jgi:gluconolactonase
VALREVASGLGFPEGPVVCADASILVSEVSKGRVSRLADGKRATFADLGGGPNGLLLLGDDVIVCQNGGASWGEVSWPFDLPGATRIRIPIGPSKSPTTPAILRVTPDGSVTTLATEFTTATGEVRPLSRPSDICEDGAGGFYLTDAGSTRERRRELTGLLHGTSDGKISEILYPLEMPNGVALAAGGVAVFVTETRTRRVWRIGLTAPGQVSDARAFVTLDSGGPMNFGGADGLCVDPTGFVVVATLGSGGVSVFDPEGTLRLWIPTGDPMTTNVTIDVAGDRLLVTLATLGKVVAVEGWRDLVAGLCAVEARPAAVRLRSS